MQSKRIVAMRRKKAAFRAAFLRSAARFSAAFQSESD